MGFNLGNAFKGALSGGMAGLATGNPWGVLAGAGIGAGIGGFSGSEQDAAAQQAGADQYNMWLTGQQPQYVKDANGSFILNPNYDPNAKGFMGQLADARNAPGMAELRTRASGGNLVSSKMMAEGIGQGQAAQMSAAAGARPGQGGLAMRNAMQASGQLAADATRAGTMAGMQESMMAAQALADRERALLGMEMAAMQGGNAADLARRQFELQALQNERATGPMSQLMGIGSAVGQYGALGGFGGGGAKPDPMAGALGNAQINQLAGALGNAQINQQFGGYLAPNYQKNMDPALQPGGIDHSRPLY